MMTKNDFIAIQRAIYDARMALLPSDFKKARNIVEQQALITAHSQLAQVFDSMARDIASTLAKQNPKFKRDEFLKGCGVR